jgi:hypothetical protein
VSAIPAEDGTDDAGPGSETPRSAGCGHTDDRTVVRPAQATADRLCDDVTVVRPAGGATLVSRAADITLLRPAGGAAVAGPVGDHTLPNDPDGGSREQRIRVLGPGRPACNGAGDDRSSAVGDGSLPGFLRLRWRREGSLAHGGEASLLLVRSRSAERTGGTPDRVLKLYRSSFMVDRNAWAAIRGLSHPNVLRLLETGDVDGHDFEVSEYLPGGSLDDLMRGPRGGDESSFPAWPRERIALVVRQVHAALGALHAASVIHRDVKPSNLLLRSREPLQLVLGDFGICRVLATGRYTQATAGTPHYVGPEGHLAGRAWDSPARDWWALGMVVLELASGRRLFRNLPLEVLSRHIALRGVDTSAVADERLRLLCRGLLVRDPEHRWSAVQVEQWLAGGSPAVHDPDPPRRRLAFRDREYAEPAQLAAAFAADAASWDAAVRRFLSWVEDGRDPGEGWHQLTEWLRSVGGDSPAAREDLAELVDHQLRPSGIPADRKLLALVRWLDPTAVPSFRGTPLTPAHLARVAEDACRELGEGRPGPSTDLVERLWSQRVLDQVAGEGGAAGSEAGRLMTLWRTGCEQLGTRPSELACGTGAPSPGGLGDDRRRRATALLLATDPRGQAEQLDRRLQAETDRIRAWMPPWWPRLLAGTRAVPGGVTGVTWVSAASGSAGATSGPAGPASGSARGGRSRIRVLRDEPAAAPVRSRVRAVGGTETVWLQRAVDLCCAQLHLPAAAQAAADALRAHEEEIERARRRRLAWEEAERERSRGRPRAVVRAVLRVLPWALGGAALLLLHGWLGSLLLGGSATAMSHGLGWALQPWTWAGAQPLCWLSAAGVPVLHLVREIRFAREAGGDYLRPIASPARTQRLRRRSERLARWREDLADLPFVGRVAVGLVGVLAAGVLAAVPLLLQLGELFVATAGVGRDRSEWQAAHQERRTRSLGSSRIRVGGRS